MPAARKMDVALFADFDEFRGAVEAAEAAGPAPLRRDTLREAARRFVRPRAILLGYPDREAARWLLARAGRGADANMLIRLLEAAGPYHDTFDAWTAAAESAPTDLARLLRAHPWGSAMATRLVLLGRLGGPGPRRRLAGWLAGQGDDVDYGAHMGGPAPPPLAMRIAAGLAPARAAPHRDFDRYDEGRRRDGALADAALSPRRAALAAAAARALADEWELGLADGERRPYLASIAPAGPAREFVRRRERAARRARVAEARRRAAAAAARPLLARRAETAATV